METSRTIVPRHGTGFSCDKNILFLPNSKHPHTHTYHAWYHLTCSNTHMYALHNSDPTCEPYVHFHCPFCGLQRDTLLQEAHIQSLA